MRPRTTRDLWQFWKSLANWKNRAISRQLNDIGQELPLVVLGIIEIQADVDYIFAS